jgi:hypothetical protein
LAWEMAASGLRISCAMPADTRPMAASFSCRKRASAVRTSSSSSTQKGSPAAPPGSMASLRRRMKRMRTRSVRRWPPSKLRRCRVLPRARAGICQRCLDGRGQHLPCRHATTAENGGGRSAHVPPAASGRRIGRAYAQLLVHDKHAVDHLLDHQPVELRLLACELEAAARRLFLARQSSGQFPRQQRDDEQAQPARPACSISALRSPPLPAARQAIEQQASR